MFYQEPIMAVPLGAFSISPGVEFVRKTNPSSEEKKSSLLVSAVQKT